MGFQVSAGVNVSEIDLTTGVPAVSTTEGGFAGVFRWGPLNKLLLISSETELVNRYGRPTSSNPETFFTAANFLAYGNKLYISRAGVTTDETGATGVLTAYANVSAVTSNIAHIVLNEDDYETKSASFEAGVKYVAKYAGDLGNSLKISVCDSAAAFQANLSVTGSDPAAVNVTSSNTTFRVGSNAAVFATEYVVGGGAVADDCVPVVNTAMQALTPGDIIEVGNNTVGKAYLKLSSITALNASSQACTSTNFAALSPVTNATHAYMTLNFENLFTLNQNVAVLANNLVRKWEYFNNVSGAPGQSTFVAEFGNTAANDELHIVVSDQDGKITGVPGQILEVWDGLSRATDAKTTDGAGLYYKNVLNDNSKWVWWGSDRSGATSATGLLVASASTTKPLSLSFINGSDGGTEATATFSAITDAYDKFASAEDVDISLILTGKSRGGTHGEQLANYLIDNIAEVRKDCVVFVSPEKADVVDNSAGDQEADIVQFRNGLRSTSYAVLDSGYKYQYDRYNDLFRYIPLNGDIAGLCVRTDNDRDPWWSPGGFNRGQIKNVVKLAWNPGKADRDILYKSGINPVVTFPGQGTVLYGDKTLLSKPSAFDRINVRRLFIVLEKAIAIAAKEMLFEFNDEFTRARFRNLVDSYLRDVQGRRGVYDYRIICDETNNTGEVIDRNEFVGDIYIKPARSINFIQLNFVAVRTGVEFSEIVGRF